MRRSLLPTASAALMAAMALFLLAPRASAVPSYSRRYGIPCSGCHSMWGALNGPGTVFRLSGYRAMAGADLTPVEKDVELSPGVTIPSTLPLSLISGVGFDTRHEQRQASDGTRTSRNGSSLALEDASIFVSAPLGKHLSTFIEFPMYESKAWEFTPTGPAAANDKTTGAVDLETESPGFEVAKFWWNNILGSSAPRDSVNLLAGITHLPLPFSPGKVRLSVNQYPIYERRALDLISPQGPGAVFSEGVADGLFRLSEPQTLFEVNGMVVPGKPISAVADNNTCWFEYHAGVANGSNIRSDTNTAKDLYGRFVVRRWGQSFGLFGIFSSEIYSDELRSEGAATGIMSGRQARNASSRFGPDLTLSLAPLGLPLTIQSQYLYNRESNPTGFGTPFTWQGGFHQLNWKVSAKTVAYARYDYLNGRLFNDGTNPAVRPLETDEVVGLQHSLEENVKFVAEYRHHRFDDRTANPSRALLTDDGFTTRMMFGF